MRFSKNTILIPEQNIKTSSVYLGFQILKILQNKEKISIFDLYSELKSKNKIFNYNATMQAIIFLFMTGSIDFDAPFIHKMK